MSTRLVALAVVGAALIAAVAVHGAPKKDEPFKRGALGHRAYRLYVPLKASVEPRTLVVALHGCWQTPEDFARGTRLNDAAERRGLLVLYPAQSRWDNVNRCWNWFDPANQSRQAGETAELAALVQAVAREQGTAPGRAITIGFSAGGFMAVNLLCAAPELVSAVAVVAGGPYRCGLGLDGALECMRGLRLDGAASAAACQAAAGRRTLAVRASLWQGDQDTVVAPANLRALETMFSRLVGAEARVTETRDRAMRVLHHDGRGDPLIEAWFVPGLGHAWSGGDPRATHTWPPGPNATDLILDFLLEPRVK